MRKYCHDRREVYSSTMGFVLSEMNDYENIFFSYTESIPMNPPHSLAISRKMVYKIGELNDVNNMFLDLPDTARKFLIINNNMTDKADAVLSEERYVMENYNLVKEESGYAIYSLIENKD